MMLVRVLARTFKGKLIGCHHSKNREKLYSSRKHWRKSSRKKVKKGWEGDLVFPLPATPVVKIKGIKEPRLVGNFNWKRPQPDQEGVCCSDCCLSSPLSENIADDACLGMSATPSSRIRTSNGP